MNYLQAKLSIICKSKKHIVKNKCKMTKNVHYIVYNAFFPGISAIFAKEFIILAWNGSKEKATAFT